MNEKYIQIIGSLITAAYGVFVVFLYAAEPRSIEEISTKARSAFDSAAAKGSVAIGTYGVDAEKFNAGLAAFRADNFVSARDLFERADPERRDTRTQYYIAYSYYRQGWGRVSSDDALFAQALGSLARVTMLDPDFRSDDPDLKLDTPAELRAELEEGLRMTIDDFNPLRVFRERK
jgi:hypothetical protein